MNGAGIRISGAINQPSCKCELCSHIFTNDEPRITLLDQTVVCMVCYETIGETKRLIKDPKIVKKLLDK